MTGAQARSLARLAGALYLTIIVCGLFAEFYVRQQLVVPGDVDATAARIRDGATLFRIGFAAETVMVLADVALAVLLYFLLHPGGIILALMSGVFRLAQVKFIGLGMMAQFGGLLLLTGAQDGAEIQGAEALTSTLMSAQGHIYDFGLFFFGVSSILTGVLIWRVAYLPRILGVLIGAAGAVYLAGSWLRFLAPHALSAFAPVYVVPIVAESALCLWLLTRGIDAARWPDRRKPAS